LAHPHRNPQRNPLTATHQLNQIHRPVTLRLL
jgi:hypothetical protein